MRLTGHATIWSDRPVVWAALHDVDVLAVSIPGCLALARVAPDRFELSVEVSIGPVMAQLDGVVQVIDCVPQSWLLLEARGTGIVSHDIAGSVRISLDACAAGCRVSYDAEVRTTETLLEWGMPLLSGLARRQIDQFATRFAAIVGTPPRSAQPQSPDEVTSRQERS